jgi:hypothetical protein
MTAQYTAVVRTSREACGSGWCDVTVLSRAPRGVLFSMQLPLRAAGVPYDRAAAEAADLLGRNGWRVRGGWFTADESLTAVVEPLR